MKINPKSQKGAITLIVLVAMLFVLTFLMSIYIKMANQAQTSAETTKQIAEQYNNIDEANTIYENYFANTDIIPIYTREHLEKIGSGEEITINNKIYTFLPDAYYTIQNNLHLSGYYDEAIEQWSAEEEWTPLPSTFTGILDGLGHTITGMYIDNPDESNQGLFGTLEGTVKNLKIIDGYINGLNDIGAIAGINKGTITNCHDEAIVLSISTNNGKVKVDGIWYASVEDYAKEKPIVIKFTINTIEHSAPQGIDWKKWCSNEEYNITDAKYVEESDNITNNLSNPLLNENGMAVKGSDIIEEGKSYTWLVEETTVINE